MFHSALSFMRLLGSVLLICTASDICRIIASFLNDPVTDIINDCTSPPCSSTQCRHMGDWSIFLAANFSICSARRVYPLLDVSPLYMFFLQFPPWQSTIYVMLSVSQFPFPPDVQIKQSALLQFPSLKGFDLCNSLFSVRPVLSTTLIRRPLSRMA